MIRRAVFLADGSSDVPLGDHLETMCAERGVEVRVATPDLRRLPKHPGHGVADRLNAVLQLDEAGFDLVFVHRDAEKQDPQVRVDEVRRAVREVRADLPAVPVVPVRMTEAWLLLDESAIRRVAGKPDGRMPIGLPQMARVEKLPDPKSTLRQVLEAASGLEGRKMKLFKSRFGEHRRLLLERLDIHGPVQDLCAWRALEASLDEALASFS